MSGVHFILDVKLVDNKDNLDKLTNIEVGKDFINNVIGISEMTIVDKPQSYKFPENEGCEVSGYSINAMLMESHVTIHTWPESLEFTFDIFSCKKFDYIKLWKFIRESFVVEVAHGSILERFHNKRYKQQHVFFDIENGF